MFSKFSAPPLRLEAPLFLIGSWPVRLVTLLIALHVGVMVSISLLLTFGHVAWVNAFVYSSSAVAQGQVWRLLTYAFVNPPNIWFAFEMLMLFYFGREVERGLGAKAFGLFYAGLILLGAVLMQLLSLSGRAQQMTGAQAVNFAIFAAFVTMHPGAQFLFGIAARWMLLALLALSSLQLLEGHQFAATFLFLSESVAAILFMKWNGYHELIAGFPKKTTLAEFLQRMAPRRVPKMSTRTAAPIGATLFGSCSTSTSFVPVPRGESALSKKTVTPTIKTINIDGVLEKISQTGMASLTDQEKEQLEEARTALLQRDRK